MEEHSLISDYVDKMLSSGHNENILVKIALPNTIHSLKKSIVLIEKVKKAIIDNQTTIELNKLIALGVSIEMMNAKIETIIQKYFP